MQGTKTKDANKKKKDDVVVRFCTNEGVKLKSLFERLSSFIDCCLEFRPDGIYTVAIDTGMIYISVSLNNLEDYMCKRPLVCGIQTNVWWKCLKNISQDQMVEIVITEEDIEQCQIQLNFVKNNNRGRIQYILTQIDIEYENIQIPDKEFTSILSIPAMEFQKALRCCGDATAVRISSDFTEIEVEQGDADDDNVQDERDDGEGEEPPTEEENEENKSETKAKQKKGTKRKAKTSQTSKDKLARVSRMQQSPEKKPQMATVPVLVMEAVDNQGTEPSVRISMVIDGCLDKNGQSLQFDTSQFCQKKDWFALRCLCEISKSASMNPTGSVVIYLSDGFPLLLDYSVGTLGTVRYALAQKMTDDEVENVGTNADSDETTSTKEITIRTSAVDEPDPEDTGDDDGEASGGGDGVYDDNEEGGGDCDDYM